MSHIDPNTLALIALGESALPADLDHVRGCVMCPSELDELTRYCGVCSLYRR